MQKVVDFLERNVQWLVLGLAGVVLLLMVWIYLLSPPVTVEADGKKLTPGEIDAATVRGPLVRVQQAIRSSADPDTLAKLEVKKYVEEFASRVAPADPLAGQILLNGGNWPRQPGAKKLDETGSPTVIAGAKPTALPTAIAAVWSAGNNGRSTVMVPDPKVKRRQNADGVAQPVDMVEVDKDWVTQAYDIDVEKLGDSFKKVFGDFEDLPPSVYDTQIVAVELIREEKMADGSWSNRTVVKPLSLHEVPPFPDQSDKQKVLEYAAWVSQHPELITQPPFYEVVEAKGDMWAPPGEETVAVQQTTPSAAPRAPRGGYPGGYPGGRGGYPGYPGGGRGGYGGYPGSGPGYPGGGYPGGAGGRRGGRGSGYAMQDGGRGAYPSYPGGYPGGIPGGYGGGYGGYPGYPGGYPGAGRAQMGGGAGAGSFNVLAPTAPVRVWAHDETVEAGKTYRYAIQYYLRNPLFQTFQIAADPKLSEQYAIKSPLSTWSAQVKVTPKVNFFLAGIGKDNVKFEVFTWQNGNWKKKVIQRAPGDLIPDTTWTVVDQRKEGNENYVLLVNQGGQIQRRDFSQDRKSPLYKQLSGDADTAKGATAAAR
jgi:hypothetical protein